MQTQAQTQSAKILAHLVSGKAITPIDALQLFGCFRLSARIWDLRDQGHSIEMKYISANGKKFAEYSMRGE